MAKHELFFILFVMSLFPAKKTLENYVEIKKLQYSH